VCNEGAAHGGNFTSRGRAFRAIRRVAVRLERATTQSDNIKLHRCRSPSLHARTGAISRLPRRRKRVVIGLHAPCTAGAARRQALGGEGDCCCVREELLLPSATPLSLRAHTPPRGHNARTLASWVCAAAMPASLALQRAFAHRVSAKVAHTPKKHNGTMMVRLSQQQLSGGRKLEERALSFERA
jgi:hypothetical protein